MECKKGILLLGGKGQRLSPLTQAVNKHLLPIFDKPMCYYSLSILMLAGIKEIALVINESDQEAYRNLFGDGSSLGLNISYFIQKEPRGIADAFLVCNNFINNQPCSLMLGDNIFYGGRLSERLKSAKSYDGATIFAYEVKNPSQFGVVNFSDGNKILSLDEKPSNPKSNYAVTGMYFYDENVSYYAKQIKPSNRGELEITDINNIYLTQGNIKAEILGRGFSWLDTGSFDNLLEASNFISVVQKNQGFLIGCLEEIALNNNWIDKSKITQRMNTLPLNSYKQYLMSLLND